MALCMCVNIIMSVKLLYSECIRIVYYVKIQVASFIPYTCTVMNLSSAI